jgi:putative thiamine transport system ATP-binding protein
MSALSLHGVSIRLGERLLLEVDASATADEPLTVMGPSGSGKSSLLAWLGGFLDSAFTANGEARLGDLIVTDLPASQRRLGLLFQDPLLFPHMSVAQNLLFALPPGATAKERRAKVEEALARVELEGLGDRDPATLSGGQQARVALTRVLLSGPRALLLDEPFSKLDTGLREATRKLVFQTARDEGLPTILVTHDEEDARAAGGKVLHL